MWAAAEGHSTLGIPEKVGKEFVEHDKEKALTPGSDYADPGFRGGVKRYPLDTHEHVVAAERFHAEEKNRAEYTEAQNAHIDKKIAAAKKKFGVDRKDASHEGMTEYEVAEDMRDGSLSSPQRYGDFWLFDLRITGTGVAYRDGRDEYAVREPDKWLSDRFVKRCNGLPVVWQHPEGQGLDEREFDERVIGTIMIPYVRDDEVWGIARIYDSAAAELMQTTHTSTSPGVLTSADSKLVELEDGTKVLEEELPLVLDHLAICEQGVWDKGGPPEGVRLDSTKTAKEQKLDEKEKEALERERDDAKMRADAAEAKLKEYEDRAKKDSEKEDMKEAEKFGKEEHEAEERAEKDKKRKDSEEEERDDESEKEALEEAEKERKDGAPEENVNANALKELKDAARRNDATIKELREQIAALRKEPTLDDAKALADAFHRADSLFQMHGEATPKAYPGESPKAYRRRLADSLRKYSSQFKATPLHDSIDGAAFDAIEGIIYNDAAAAVKTPSVGGFTGLREVKRLGLGNRQISEFVGDSAEWVRPFQHPSLYFIKPVVQRDGR